MMVNGLVYLVLWQIPFSDVDRIEYSTSMFESQAFWSRNALFIKMFCVSHKVYAVPAGGRPAMNSPG